MTYPPVENNIERIEYAAGDNPMGWVSIYSYSPSAFNSFDGSIFIVLKFNHFHTSKPGLAS